MANRSSNQSDVPDRSASSATSTTTSGCRAKSGPTVCPRTELTVSTHRKMYCRTQPSRSKTPSLNWTNRWKIHRTPSSAIVLFVVTDNKNYLLTTFSYNYHHIVVTAMYLATYFLCFDFIHHLHPNSNFEVRRVHIFQRFPIIPSSIRSYLITNPTAARQPVDYTVLFPNSNQLN